MRPLGTTPPPSSTYSQVFPSNNPSITNDSHSHHPNHPYGAFNPGFSAAVAGCSSGYSTFFPRKFF